MRGSARTDRFEVITFKASPDLVEAMKGIRNRSEFIRSAILSALDNTCPLCRGTGCLTPKQLEHWDLFSGTHSVEQCEDCHEFRLLCEHEPRAS